MREIDSINAGIALRQRIAKFGCPQYAEDPYICDDTGEPKGQCGYCGGKWYEHALLALPEYEREGVEELRVAHQAGPAPVIEDIALERGMQQNLRRIVALADAAIAAYRLSVDPDFDEPLRREAGVISVAFEARARALQRMVESSEQQLLESINPAPAKHE